MTMADFEVSGTITTGVRVYCPDCEEWFAEWSSREVYPTVAVIVAACEHHECPQEAPWLDLCQPCLYWLQKSEDGHMWDAP